MSDPTLSPDSQPLPRARHRLPDKRRWGRALVAGVLLCAVSAAVVLATHEPTYRSQAIIGQPISLSLTDQVVIDDSSLGSPVILSDETLDHIVRLLSTDVKEGRTGHVAEQDRAAELRTKLRQHTQVQTGPSPGFLTVSYDDQDAEYATQVCGTIAHGYLDHRSQRQSAQFANFEKWLGPEVQRWEQEVKENNRRVGALNPAGLEIDAIVNATMQQKLQAQIRELKVDVALRQAIRKRERSSRPDGDKTEQPKNDGFDREQVRLEILEEACQELVAEARANTKKSAECQFAQDQLDVSANVLTKLRQRYAEAGRDARLARDFDAMVVSKPSSFPLQKIPHERVAIAGGISFVTPFLMTCLLPGVRRFEPAELE